jgi:hypothetical protein
MCCLQIVADRYGFTDIYNGCLFRLLLRFNNTGPPDAVLYDMPLGWWDHDWKGCFKSRCVRDSSSMGGGHNWIGCFRSVELRRCRPVVCAVLYDLPLGWWDHDWKGRFKSRCMAC